GNGNGGPKPVSDHRGRGASRSGAPLVDRELSTALSASLKAELLREIEHLSSADDAALWARRKLAAKNRLSAADAKQLEDAFGTRLSLMMRAAKTPVGKRRTGKTAREAKIDKGVLLFPEPRRVRDPEHIRHVTKQPCVICGRRPSDAHH